MKRFFSSVYLKKGDGVVFLLILAIIFSTAVLFYRKPAASAKQIVIYVNGEEYKTYQLSHKYLNNIVVPVNGHTKYGYNHIKIEDGAVYIADSTCPNQDCVKMGKITEEGDILVCLPYKVVIRMEGGEAPDAVSY